MDGDLGFYTIKPDQIVISTTIFIIIIIPIFDYIVYPLMAKVGIKSPLHKVACGYTCCGTSFIVAAFIEWKIKDNEVHMLWLLPQYFLIALSEVFVWVSIVNFAYTQAPESMKSVMTSFVYVTIAFGDLIVIVISASSIVQDQIYEFLMYSVFMVFNIICFIFLAKNYKYIDKK